MGMTIAATANFGRHRRLAESDDSDEEGSQIILTTARAAELCPRPFRLVARSKAFTSVQDMAPLASLDYVDLAGNALTSVEGLGSLRRLKTLDLRGNKLSDIEPLAKNATIRVINISDNNFVSTEWLSRAAFAGDLEALVARGNRLARLESLSALKNIKTLVLSNNQLEDASLVGRLASLTKLSISHNEIRVIPDSFGGLHNLCELRIAHNRLSVLPKKDILTRLSKLKILDIGHNVIPSFENLEACGSSLVQVNLRDNPGWHSNQSFAEHIKDLCPQLEVLDGQRIAGGRRKLRVNRQRIEAGFPLEPDRRFARPPPPHYLKPTQQRKEKGDEPRQESGSSPEQHRMSGNKRKRPVDDDSEPADEGVKSTKKNDHVGEQDGDDNVVEADDFIKMARSQGLSGPNTQIERKSAETTAEATKPKQKRKTSKLPKQSTDDDIGVGGQSKW